MGKPIIRLTYSNRQNHSSVLDVQSFRAAGCDTDYYLVVAKMREGLAVNKDCTDLREVQSQEVK
jgi:hypothetical protein